MHRSPHPGRAPRAHIGVRLLALLALLVSVGCGTARSQEQPSAADPRRPVVGLALGDSAGIALIVNSTEPPPGSTPWRLAAEPELTLGRPEGGAPEHVFYRVAGGAVLEDGRIVVAEDETHELRFFGPSGGHVHTIGGGGATPPPFERIRLIGVFQGDSLLAYDNPRRQFSVVTPDGSVARTFPMPASLVLGSSVVGVLADGSVLVKRTAPVPPGDTPYRRGAMLDLVTPDGGVGSALGVFPAQESLRFVPPGGIARGLMVPFGRTVHHAASGDRIAVATDDLFSVRIYDGRAAPERIVRQSRPPTPIDPAVLDRTLADLVEGLVRMGAHPADTTQRRIIQETAVRQIPRHATQPALASVRLDRVGNLWVQEYEVPGAPRTTWQVFGPDGVLVSRVQLPAGVSVLDIGDSHVLGSVTDALTVERVVLYRLLKEGE